MRLLTRSDFDGLICAALLKQAGVIDSWKFTHPKDLQDGSMPVSGNDVLANVPYVPGCGMWFDHHSSEVLRPMPKDFQGAFAQAPSAARVIWDYYGGDQKFPPHFVSMVEAADKMDSGNLTEREILNPKGWILLSFIMDPRTGLGRFKNFRISNYALMELLIECCQSPMPVADILKLPDVDERVQMYFAQDEQFTAMTQSCTTLHGNCAVVDLREQNPIYTGNRFKLYAMFPACNVSVHVLWGLNRRNVALTVGKSILNRTNKADVGALMFRYGGGGHKAVGTCQVALEDADRILGEIVTALTAD